MNPKPGPMVLLLEDDPLAAWTGRRILEQMGCRVMDADCCQAAEEAWLANPFDLVIADHRLPDGFGVELIGRMRAAGRTTPVICLTAEAEVISETQRQELQIGAVVGKPINLETLRTAVNHCAAPSEPAAAAVPPPARRRTIGHYDLFPCRQVDILRDLDSLESLSRHPTSPCERAALMDSIVL